MLARALSDVEAGFYIDVGAQDPEDGSVTKHFYDQGWSGLNFEPSETYHARLSAERPRDLTLRCAVGDRPGNVTFYELADTGLSTIIEAVSEDFSGSRTEHTVPMTTLDGACTAYGVTTVHFLKIDVEGAEELVLRGTRFEAVRPWIVVVEATRPNSTEPHFAHWEPLLTERGYQFVYADGLNRFYLADEQAHRASAFAVPPNYCDGFVLAGEARAQDNLRHHIAIIDRLGEQIASQQTVLESQASHLAEINRRAEGQHAEILRLVALLDAAAEREKAGTAHHVGLIQEAAERAEAQHAEITRLIGLLDDAAEREKAGTAHHVGLIQEAAERAEAQHAEITRLSVEHATEQQVRARQDEALRGAQGEVERQASALAHAAAELGRRDRQLADLSALATRQSRQIAFRDDKIAWLTQDRDRFRARYERTVSSLSWRITGPLRWGRPRPNPSGQVAPAAPLPVATEPRPVGVDAPEAATVLVAEPVTSLETASLPVPEDLPEPARWLSVVR